MGHDGVVAVGQGRWAKALEQGRWTKKALGQMSPSHHK